MARKPKFQKFEMPIQFLENLYEMTGGPDKNKGYFMIHIDEDGNGQIKSKYDSQATEFAIMKFLDIYNNQYQTRHEIEFEREMFDGSEDDD
jgi:hypothetical protein